MAIKDIDPEKYYPMSKLHPIVREDFFGWCDKKFFRAIKFGVGKAKCTVVRNGEHNSPYQVMGAEIVKFLEEVKREVAVRGFPIREKAGRKPKKKRKGIKNNSK